MKQWLTSLRDKRLMTCALLPSAFFALMTVLGGDLRANGALQQPFWRGAVLFVLWTVLFGAVLTVLFALVNRASASKGKPEGWFGHVTGSFAFAFLLLIACWLPAWLAFWPGSFSPDSITQFYSYYNQDHSAHHPLLHTLLLGFCMMLGIDNHPEAYATGGLALYCGIQLVLTAGCAAYGVSWLKRRGAPVWARIAVLLLFALNPFYAPWGFYAQKDVLFGALVLVFCLQLADLWRFGWKPLRLISFAVIAVLMMLFRNNGIYALALLLPFAVWWAKGRRIRMTALIAVCMALYVAANAGLMYVLYASEGSKVEILSIPLQQIARTLKEDPSARELDEEGVLDTLFGEQDIPALYDEQIADPLKWSVDDDALDENIPALLKLWAKMGIRNFDTYVEAFLAQNLPYLLPYSDMRQSFDFGVQQPDWFPIEEISYLPALRTAYESYEDTLSFMGIPGTRLLCDPALYVWLALAGFAFACFRRMRGMMAAFGFLIAVWFTCLLGPVAIMRYLLGLYDAVPVLWAAMLIRKPADVSAPETNN